MIRTTGVEHFVYASDGYGGVGGGTDSGHTISGAVYGSFTQPLELGSGGGTTNGAPGGAGGGRVKLNIGTLQLEASPPPPPRVTPPW